MQPNQTIYRNRPDQFIRFYVKDSQGLPVDGLAGQITATIKLDQNEPQAASQQDDITGEGGGAYTLPLSQAETQFGFGMVVAFAYAGTGDVVIWAVIPECLNLRDGS
jgi:hypothetical protein